ncbi:MAG: hypothetical protein Q8P19_00340 [bacterium]|nr:hypothetical protein [bacterium]
MGYRRVELTVGEWFHCYSRTIDYSRPFEENRVAERFIETLYLANQSAPMPESIFHQKYSHNEIFLQERASPLVAIGAYSVMPTHYHLFAQPVIEGGLSEFMHKVGTGFTRYFNQRQGRVGNLFVKPFRAKHVSSQAYFAHLPNYIHLNATELFEPEWKKGHVRDMARLEKQLRAYPYSSLPEYMHIGRPQASVLDAEAVSVLKESLPPLQRSLADAAEYYQFLDLAL